MNLLLLYFFLIAGFAVGFVGASWLDFFYPAWQSRFRRWWYSERIKNIRSSVGNFLFMCLFWVCFVLLCYLMDSIDAWNNRLPIDPYVY